MGFVLIYIYKIIYFKEFRCNMTLSFYPPKDFLIYSSLLRKENLISGHPEPVYFKALFRIHVAVVKSARLDRGCS